MFYARMLLPYVSKTGVSERKEVEQGFRVSPYRVRALQAVSFLVIYNSGIGSRRQKSDFAHLHGCFARSEERSSVW